MPTTATKAKPAKKRSAPSASAAAKKARRGTGETLPAWGDLKTPPPSKLAKRASRAKAGAKKATHEAAAKVRRSRPLDVVPSLRFGLATMIGCLVITLFLSHAYATRALLDDLQEARRLNEQLHLTHQRLQGDVDRMVRPSTVLSQAARLGLEEGVAYGPTIRLAD